MTDPASTGPRQWVHRKHFDDGGWAVECSLCGRPFRRTFRADKWDDPQRAAADYVGEHLESRSHLAAVAAYREPVSDNPDDDLTEEEMLLRAIFGERQDEPSVETRRRKAAKSAALAFRNLA